MVALETIDGAHAAYPRTQAEAWGRENVILLSELYVASALRTRAQTRVRSRVETIPGTAVSTALTEALNPKGRPSFKEDLERACQLLDHGQAKEARQVLTALRPRLDRALEALQRADDRTRKADHYLIDQVRVAKELPLFWLAWGEVHFLLPEARQRLQRARRELNPKPKAQPGTDPGASPAPSATPG